MDNHIELVIYFTEDKKRFTLAKRMYGGSFHAILIYNNVLKVTFWKNKKRGQDALKSNTERLRNH